MSGYDLIIIGGGLSGLAAGIRYARFGHKTLILEQHSLPGGLNSYYFRAGHLLETGLHAMTNFAPPGDKRAPLNRLFRQLKLSRKSFITREQIGSEIRFPQCSLRFNNDINLLTEEINHHFPHRIDQFRQLLIEIATIDPFTPVPWRSTRQYLKQIVNDSLLENMLLLPLMVYGNAEEHDMDLAQFVIMFRSIFLEGLFRPAGTMKDFLEEVQHHYREFGGELRFRSPVKKLIYDEKAIKAAQLENGEEISCKAVFSTIGIPGTARIADWPLEKDAYTGQISFTETISVLPQAVRNTLTSERTIIFYNNSEEFNYQKPVGYIDPEWGVICFPENFLPREKTSSFQIRITNSANYQRWSAINADQYRQRKQDCAKQAITAAEKIIGPFADNITYQDSFTPTTIERFSKKPAGAVYGSPIKIKDGRTPYDNLFLAGTDQGYLGIVGSMLSGVTMVNHHLLL